MWKKERKASPAAGLSVKVEQRTLHSIPKSAYIFLYLFLFFFFFFEELRGEVKIMNTGVSLFFHFKCLSWKGGERALSTQLSFILTRIYSRERKKELQGQVVVSLFFSEIGGVCIFFLFFHFCEPTSHLIFLNRLTIDSSASYNESPTRHTATRNKREKQDVICMHTQLDLT